MNKEQTKHVVSAIRVISVGQFVTFGAEYFRGDSVGIWTLAGCMAAFIGLEYIAHNLLGRHGE